MKVVKFTLSVVVVFLSSYSLLIRNYTLLPYTLLLLGIFLLTMGVSEFQEKRKVTAITLFLVAGFNIFVTVFSLFQGE